MSALGEELQAMLAEQHSLGMEHGALAVADSLSKVIDALQSTDASDAATLLPGLSFARDAATGMATFVKAGRS